MLPKMNKSQLNAEQIYAEILCKRNNLRAQMEANMAPGASEHKLRLTEIYLRRAEANMRWRRNVAVPTA